MYFDKGVWVIVHWRTWQRKITLNLGFDLFGTITVLVSMKKIKNKSVVIWASVRFQLWGVNCAQMFSLKPQNSHKWSDGISAYNINTISARQVMTINKDIIKQSISWSNTKFSELTS